MDSSFVDRLKTEFPGKNVFPNHPDAPTEIVVELHQTDVASVAIALIERSEPHYHKERTELYEVLEGKLTLHVNDREYVLGPNDSRRVFPHEVHWVTDGQPARVRVTVTPPWTPDDHHLTGTPSP